MKIKFSLFIGFAMISLSLVVYTASAQEGVPTNEIPDLNFYQDLQEEKPLLFEPTNNLDRTTQNKEHLISPSKSNKPKVGTSDGSKIPAIKPEEEDALSFNFLYYIIQKFKISDIVEQ